MPMIKYQNEDQAYEGISRDHALNFNQAIKIGQS